jgi:hypothetical protein
VPLLLSLLLLACSPEADPDVPLEGLLGTGDWEWEALESGDEIPVIQGPQGGFHLLGSVRVSGMEAGDADNISSPDNPTTSFYVWVDGVNLTPGARYIQGLDTVVEEVDPYTHEMVGRFAILDIDADDELDGVELLFEVVVEDVDGNLVSDALELVAYPHPYNL